MFTCSIARAISSSTRRKPARTLNRAAASGNRSSPIASASNTSLSPRPSALASAPSAFRLSNYRSAERTIPSTSARWLSPIIPMSR